MKLTHLEQYGTETGQYGIETISIHHGCNIESSGEWNGD